jgi:hypothetical protein
VEQYTYSPSRPSWPLLGWMLPLPFFLLMLDYACQIEIAETLACLLTLNVEAVFPLDAPRRPMPSRVIPIYSMVVRSRLKRLTCILYF